MKILQVIPYFEWSYGGPVRVLYQLSRELAKRGHDVTIYTTDVGRRNPLTEKQKIRFDSNSKVQYFKCQNNWIADRLKLHVSFQMFSAIKDNLTDFDVVHLHEARGIPNLLVWYYAKKFGIPYILQARGSLPKTIPGQNVGLVCLKIMFDTILGNNILRDTSKVIALCRIEAEQYMDMRVPEEKIAFIPNGIDLSDYANLPHKGSFKEKFNIPKDTKIVLYLGRIHKIKGIDFLVKAYAHLIEKFNNVLLVVVGPDDGYLDKLRGLISSLNIVDDVLFTGPLYGKDKLEAYVDADIFVLPSRYETFPNVVLEAYACSKLVIASDVMSIPDIVLHGKTGLLFQAGDSQELTKMLLYALTHLEEAEKMGHRARKFVEEKYSIDKVVDSLKFLYETILKEKQGK